MIRQTDLMKIANGTTDSVAMLIAHRYQFGSIPTGMVKFAGPDLWESIKGTAGNVGNWMGDRANDVGDWIGGHAANALGNDVTKRIGEFWNSPDAEPWKYGLYGAGIGGALGLGSGLLGKKKKPISSALTGALMGGALGGGGRWAYDRLRKQTPEELKAKDLAISEEQRLAAEAMRTASGQSDAPQAALPTPPPVTPNGPRAPAPVKIDEVFENLKKQHPNLATNLEALQSRANDMPASQHPKVLAQAANLVERDALAQKNRYAIEAKQKPEEFKPRTPPGMTQEEANQTPSKPLGGNPVSLTDNLNYNALRSGVQGLPFIGDLLGGNRKMEGPVRNVYNEPGAPDTAPENRNPNVPVGNQFEGQPDPTLKDFWNAARFRAGPQGAAALFTGKRLVNAARGGVHGLFTKQPATGSALGNIGSRLGNSVTGMLQGATAQVPGLGSIPGIGGTGGRYDPVQAGTKSWLANLKPDKLTGTAAAMKNWMLGLKQKQNLWAEKLPATWIDPFGMQGKASVTYPPLAKGLDPVQTDLPIPKGMAQARAESMPMKTKLKRWGMRTGLPYAGAYLGSQALQSQNPSAEQTMWEQSGVWDATKGIGNAVGNTVSAPFRWGKHLVNNPQLLNVGPTTMPKSSPEKLFTPKPMPIGAKPIPGDN